MQYWVNDSMTRSLVLFVAINDAILSKWFNDSFTCFVNKLICVFEQINIVNDSVTHSKTVTCFVSEWITVFQSIGWVEWFDS